MIEIQLTVTYIANTYMYNHENNNPILRFRTNEEMINFFKELQSCKSENIDTYHYGYFVINYTNAIPENLRDIHRYEKMVDVYGEKRTVCYDGYFNLRDNFKILYNANIDDNVSWGYGFSDYIWQNASDRDKGYEDKVYDWDIGMR